jgi:hypothetical protein
VGVEVIEGVEVMVELGEGDSKGADESRRILRSRNHERTGPLRPQGYLGAIFGLFVFPAVLGLLFMRIYASAGITSAVYKTGWAGTSKEIMSKGARHAHTGCFVKTVMPTMPSVAGSTWQLGEDAQTALAERVFTGDMFLTLSVVDEDRYPPSRVVCRTMRVGHKGIAALVCKAWNPFMIS